jgi:hypothetical protein
MFDILDHVFDNAFEDGFLIGHDIKNIEDDFEFG